MASAEGAASVPASVQVYQRVADKDGFRGTVRYVGPVATSKTADAVYAGAFLREGECAHGVQLLYAICERGAARHFGPLVPDTLAQPLQLTSVHARYTVISHCRRGVG
jgi:hypothetical protein